MITANKLEKRKDYLMRKYGIREHYGRAYEVHGGVPDFVLHLLRAIDWVIENLQDSKGVIKLPKWFQFKKWLQIGKLLLNILNPS